MKQLILILLTIISLHVHGQSSSEGLVGIYESVGNKFERHSILILKKDSVFIYKYGVGGCQGEIKGNWIIENNKVRFTNDQEFLNHQTIFYPNLSLATWTVKKNAVKPDSLVDSGCIKENQIHLKK
ncbi:MAG: hypothetical protein ACFCUU_18090 [Cyclobacteriaceae bacterium]